LGSHIHVLAVEVRIGTGRVEEVVDKGHLCITYHTHSRGLSVEAAAHTDRESRHLARSRGPHHSRGPSHSTGLFHSTDLGSICQGHRADHHEPEEVVKLMRVESHKTVRDTPDHNHYRNLEDHMPREAWPCSSNRRSGCLRRLKARLLASCLSSSRWTCRCRASSRDLPCLHFP